MTSSFVWKDSVSILQDTEYRIANNGDNRNRLNDNNNNNNNNNNNSNNNNDNNTHNTYNNNNNNSTGKSLSNIPDTKSENENKNRIKSGSRKFYDLNESWNICRYRNVYFLAPHLSHLFLRQPLSYS